MDKPIIEVTNLSKRYQIGASRVHRKLFGLANPQEKGYWALRNISLKIYKGETVGIIGKNGAGKSTILKLLSRITPPTGGQIILRGKVSSLLEVGTGFHAELTGLENIYLNGVILGMKKREITEKLPVIIAFSGISEFLNTPVKHYSSGMYVRLAFAVAAHLDPDILLIDEVLAVGDAEFQKRCLGKMEEVTHKTGRTILFVSHNLAAIKQICSRAILIEGGKIIKEGSTENVIARYLATQPENIKGEIIWKKNRPGDSNVKLRSLKLFAGNKRTRSVFGTNESISVEVKYVISKRISNFRFGLSLFASDETYVFYTCDTDGTGTKNRSREKGEYVSRCEIPPNFLNTGSYTIALGGGIFGNKTIFSDLPRLRFEAVSTGGPTGEYNEIRKGVVCPKLLWQIDKL